ncbi:MAG: site-specific integrase [Acidobacteriota bacterium]|nr:site-specific integrase [Acidobacteriota bacterium]
MAIKVIYSEKEKPAWSYDYKQKRWKGFLLNIWKFNGVGKPLKRIRIQYARRIDAEAAELEIEIEKKNARAGVFKSAHKRKITLRDLFDKRLELIQAVPERGRAIRVFNYFIETTGNIAVSEIRTAHFAEFNRRRAADGLKPASIRREITILSAALKRANESFTELEDFICPRIARPSAPKESKQRIITERERKLIVDYLTREKAAKETTKEFENRIRISRMFDIAWLLGLRFGEIAKLRKTDFREAEKSLRVVRWKTGTVSQLDFLPDVVIDILKAASADSETDYIFTHSGARPKNFYPILARACKANKIPYGRDTDDGIVFHTTRHSFVSRLMQVTDIATAQSYSGHQSNEQLLHYAHTNDESRKQAMAKLYGTAGDLDLKKLKKIFDKVKAGKMTFEKFYNEIGLLR